MTRGIFRRAAGLALATPAARAQGAPTAADKAAADTLFNDGKKLLGKNDALACEKFEASLARAHQPGSEFAHLHRVESIAPWGE